MCDGLILQLNPYSGCPLWPIFTSLPCNCSTGQTPVTSSVTNISDFTGSTHASGDLYPVGLLAFENVVQISHILEKSSKNLTWSQGGFGRGEWLGRRPHRVVFPYNAVNLLQNRGGFDRQPIAKNHKNKPVFPNICPKQHVTLDIFVRGSKPHQRTLWKITRKFCVQPVRDTPDGVAVKQLLFWALTLSVLPGAVILLLSTIPFQQRCLGWLGTGTYTSVLTDVIKQFPAGHVLHHHEEVCRGADDLVPSQNTSRFRKKCVIKNRERLLNRLSIPHQRFK